MTAPTTSNPDQRPSVFARIAGGCHDRRKLVVGIWVIALVVIGGLSGALGNNFRDQFDLPDSDSKTGFDILDRDFGGKGAGVTGTIVFRAEQGVDDPEVQAAMEELFDEVADQRGRDAVESPYAPGGERQIAVEGDDAGKHRLRQRRHARRHRVRRRRRDRRLDPRGASRHRRAVQVELGGCIFAEFEPPSSELIGLAFAIVILILAFGSVLAMGLPIGVALFGIGIGTSLVILLSHVIDDARLRPVHRA